MNNLELGTEIRNTRSMDMQPTYQDDISHLDEFGDNEMQLLPVFTGQGFTNVVQYPIIVESWDKKNCGRHKRRWLAEFTQAERNTIGKYHGRFYRWYLVSGVPKNVSCRLKTLQLLKRAVDFFASL